VVNLHRYPVEREIARGVRRYVGNPHPEIRVREIARRPRGPAPLVGCAAQRVRGFTRGKRCRAVRRSPTCAAIPRQPHAHPRLAASRIGPGV